jgi:hypothetical protein
MMPRDRAGCAGLRPVACHRADRPRRDCRRARDAAAGRAAVRARVRRVDGPRARRSSRGTSAARLSRGRNHLNAVHTQVPQTVSTTPWLSRRRIGSPQSSSSATPARDGARKSMRSRHRPTCRSSRPTSSCRWVPWKASRRRAGECRERPRDGARSAVLDCARAILRSPHRLLVGCRVSRAAAEKRQQMRALCRQRARLAMLMELTAGIAART